MTEDQIISLYQWDHNVRHADGGTDDYWNLEPVLISRHRHKTATVDVPQLAKSKRLRDKLAAFNARMAAKDQGEAARHPKSKIKSRGFDKRLRKKVSGRVEPRQ